MDIIFLFFIIALTGVTLASLIYYLRLESRHINSHRKNFFARLAPKENNKKKKNSKGKPIQIQDKEIINYEFIPIEDFSVSTSMIRVLSLIPYPDKPQLIVVNDSNKRHLKDVEVSPYPLIPEVLFIYPILPLHKKKILLPKSPYEEEKKPVIEHLVKEDSLKPITTPKNDYDKEEEVNVITINSDDLLKNLPKVNLKTEKYIQGNYDVKLDNPKDIINNSRIYTKDKVSLDPNIFLHICFVIINIIVIFILYALKLPYSLIILIISGINLFINLFSYLFKASNEEDESTVSLSNISILSIYIFGIIFIVIIVNLFVLKNFDSNLIFSSIIISIGILIYRHGSLVTKSLFGLPLILLFWHFNLDKNFSLQEYVLPVFFYLLAVSFLFHKKSGVLDKFFHIKKKEVKRSYFNVEKQKPIDVKSLWIGRYFLITAYILELFILLFETIFTRNVNNAFYGYIVIGICLASGGYGLSKKNRYIVILSIYIIGVVALAEMYAIISQYISSINFSSYFIIGAMFILDIAIYILSRMEKREFIRK